jgi:hypothetical protein
MPSEIGLVRFDFAAQGRPTFTILVQVAANHLVGPFSTVAVDPKYVGRLQGWHLQGETVNELMELAVR